MQKHLYKRLFFCCAVAFFIVLPFLTSTHSLATEMLIFAIFALGYDIVFGYTGFFRSATNLLRHRRVRDRHRTRPPGPLSLSGPRHRHGLKPARLMSLPF